jgi:NADPH2:quinone reductase
VRTPNDERSLRSDWVRLPDDISFEQAAGVMLRGMTAYVLLHRVTSIGPGDTILVHAAAGGTGLLLSQWSAARGAKVLGTVSTPEKAALASARGCEHPIVGTEADLVACVNELTNGRGVRVVYDSIGQQRFMTSLDCLSPMGLMVRSASPPDPSSRSHRSCRPRRARCS